VQADDHFEELLSLVENYFKTPSNASYGLHLAAAVLNSPDMTIPVQSWVDVFDYAKALPHYDPTKPFRVSGDSSKESMRTLNMKWVCKTSVLACQ
jgi:hypothetical protein